MAVCITSLALDGRAGATGRVEDGLLRCRRPLPPVTSSCFVNAAIWAFASRSCASMEVVDDMGGGGGGTTGGTTGGMMEGVEKV